MCDWAENTVGFENYGIPIPRNQGPQLFIRPAFCGDQFISETASSSPSRNLIAPPNSLIQDILQLNTSNEVSRSSISPCYNNDSPLIPSGNFDIDMEIKMEPIDELIDISIPDSHQRINEDNLLDNVNFEDLLMTDEMDSTTCLDPQHSSPAAMAAVHPNEVFGTIGGSTTYQPLIQNYLNSGSAPVKTENISFDGHSTSFPRHAGVRWNRQDSYPSTLHGEQNIIQPSHLISPLNSDGDIKPNNLFLNLSSQSRVKRVTLDSISVDNNRGLEDYSSFSGQGDLQYTQLQPVMSSTSSALHDLLVNSPSTSSIDPLQRLSRSTLSPQSLNLDGCSVEVPVGQSVPGDHSSLLPEFCSRLSSSAPTNNSHLDQIWQRREPRQHLLSTGSLAEEFRGSASSLSTGGGIVSPISYEFSIDEGIDSDSENEPFDSDSDNESLLSEDLINIGSSNIKKDRHFWQYNVQAKGPKGQRVNITPDEDNPYNLTKIMDPVFSPLCSVQGIKHSGKARRGDGNDLTPSPRKLVSIGIELNKLNKRINEMAPVSELPSTIRSKSRKEKNKLASRACRLKKKAQHEANKIKLFGLEQERKAMMALLVEARDDLVSKLDGIKNDTNNQDSGEIKNELQDTGQVQHLLTARIEKAAKIKTKQRIAGFTTEFVNKVIEYCRNGDPSGGLNELSENFIKNAATTTNETESSFNYNNQLYS